MTSQIASKWARQFGLAATPLFTSETVNGAEHQVLLDGGYGSFAVSSTNDKIWEDDRTAQWAWSSDLPHHVTVTDAVVAVTRWDKPKAELLSRDSVDAHLESFYTYLTTDRVRSTRRVVDHVLGLYRRIRTLVAHAKLDDERSVEAFLGFLDLIIERESSSARAAAERPLPTSEFRAMLSELPESGIAALVEDLEATPEMRSYRLFPDLAVRHAGTEIFQEAHFALLRAPDLDLFGYPAASKARPITRGGAHFTPAPLARSVIEQALQHLGDLSARATLTLLDPACGSGAFLQEALRTLRRLQFKGRIILAGRDVSPAAIAMAKFVAERATRDWPGSPEIEIDIRVGDSLVDPLPQSDLILMNPPFVAWAALSSDQKHKMAQILGADLQGRGDLSMAFVSRAVAHLVPGGALGVLLPASLLTLEAAAPWRKGLMDQAQLRLLASIGDYGLFAHALVQVAAAVFSKGPPTDADYPVTALVTSNTGDATGNALRSLRKVMLSHAESEGDGWRIFNVPSTALKRRPTWRVTSPKVESAIFRLAEAGTVKVSDLFDVRQGVLTGLNRAFLLNHDEFEALPPRERKHFIPAVMNESIQDGELRPGWWVFYPYTVAGPEIETEEALKSTVPTYMKRYLAPHRHALERRSNIVRGNRTDWWGISERRATWIFDPKPRIVSKYFGESGGFALDAATEYVVVQGYAWLPKFGTDLSAGDEVQAPEMNIFPLTSLMQAYVALLNAPRFTRLLEIFCPHVAGGQFNLSPRYIGDIPILDLASAIQDERLGRLVSRLSELGRRPQPRDPQWANSADRILGEVYGPDFFDEL